MRILIPVVFALATILTPVFDAGELGFIHVWTDRQEPQNVRILFVGDLLYDRTVRTYADREGDAYLFSCMHSALVNYDLVVANLEGPITHYPSLSETTLPGEENNTRFTMPLRTGRVLADNNIQAVSIGNNHIFDFGREGVDETRAALASAGVLAFGDPTEPANTSVTTQVGGQRIALVAFNAFFGTDAQTIAHIAQYDEDVFVVVFAHWGDEYSEVSNQQRSWARDFVDAGANLIVGAHPHVVQEMEEYRGVPVYYSLGNFIFDQYQSEAVTSGLALEVHLEEGELTAQIERPIKLGRDRRTCFADRESF